MPVDWDEIERDFRAQMAGVDEIRLDRARVERFADGVRSGRLSSATNRVARMTLARAQELPELEAVEGAERTRLERLGRAAIEAGQVAVCVLNGGMATRFGGRVKGIVEAVGGRSFLEIKLGQARAYGAVPFLLMNSFATHQATAEFLVAHDLNDGVFPFLQGVSLRLTREGDLYRDAAGHVSPYAPGHGDFPDALRDAGLVESLRARGVRWLTLSNVDNLGAELDPLLIGFHVDVARPLTVEVTDTRPGDVGGAPAFVDGVLQIVEGFRYPEGFDPADQKVINANSFVFSLDVVAEDHPLTWFYVEKKVDGAPAVQIERLVNELSAHVPTSFLRVPRKGPRGRFIPIKTPDDLDTLRADPEATQRFAPKAAPGGYDPVMARKLVLIDASSNIFRAFYAIPHLTNAAGVPTNATLGFVTMLQKVLRECAPDYAVVVWDAPGPKRRKEVYAEYKATRDATPEDLRAQFANIRRLVAAYRIADLEYEGEEADDVIATLAHKARAEGLDVEIVSMDKDLMQIVDEHVTLLDTMRDRRFGPAQVEERFGVPPDKVLDVRALVGDSSDNIPGVKGIGEKGAAKLIDEFGDLDNLLAHVDDVKQKRPREALRENADMARLSRELSRLREDLPLELDLKTFELEEPDREVLIEILRELEFTRLLEELDAGGAPVEAIETNTQIVRDAKTLAECVSKLSGQSRLGAACVLEPDEAMRGELVALCLADSPESATLVAVSEVGEGAALETLAPLFGDAQREWVGHDLKRLDVALGRRGVTLAGKLLDVGVAAYVDNPSQQTGKPETLARAYQGRDLPSAETVFGKGAKRRSADTVPLEELAGFHGATLASALDVEPAIEAKLGESGQLALFHEIEVPLVRVLAHMERLGVRVDEPRLEALSKRLADELAGHESRIYELAGEKFNVGSPKQLQHILFEKLALPPTKKTKTGFSTDESVLEDLAAQGFELPGEILVHRKLSKLKGTYVDALPGLVHPETGRIHCSFNQTVAATGRLSSSNPNLQNIPIRTPTGQEIRAAFIPAEGLRLLSADYSQIELRILAHLSQDESLLVAFREGADIHVRTASQVFGVPEDEVDAEQRSRTKAINFGIIYGQSAFGLARNLGIAQAEAREHISAYFERYPGVKAFLDDAVARAKRDGFAETIDGRRRYLPDLHSRNRVLRQAAERMATNSVIQGTAADFIKKAMIGVQAALDGGAVPGARMILQVHDELVFETPPESEADLTALVLEKMQNVGEIGVPLEVHVGAGATWLEAH